MDIKVVTHDIMCYKDLIIVLRSSFTYVHIIRIDNNNPYFLVRGMLCSVYYGNKKVSFLRNG